MNTLFPVIGQTDVLDMLHRVDATDRYANAYLFHGPQGVGKEAVAMEFAAIMNCQSEQNKPCGECKGCKKMRSLQHPNAHLIFALPGGGSGTDPLKGLSEEVIEIIQKAIARKSENPYSKIQIKNAQNIKISSIRAMQKDVHLAKSEAGRKIVLIFEAERMNKSAFNSILKIVEEPPEDTSFIFTTNSLHQIPETIRSRSQQVPLRLLTEKDILHGLEMFAPSLDKSDMEKISRLSNGDFGFALSLSRKNLQDLDTQVLDFIRAVMQGRAIAINEQVQTLEKLSDLERTRFLLLVQLWFRDANRWAKTESDDQIIFRQMLDKIQGFVEYYPEMNYQSAQILLESSVDYVERNVYPRLALFSLIVQLHKATQGILEEINYANRHRYQSNYLRGV
ncbi:MAG: AAA family ATPase [Candidatus Marinimicrobia bacterium]|nr:AAA family ATPase [Candidatus Neomarinimicrobiota bacterium]